MPPLDTFAMWIGYVVMVGGAVFIAGVIMCFALHRAYLAMLDARTYSTIDKAVSEFKERKARGVIGGSGDDR